MVSVCVLRADVGPNIATSIELSVQKRVKDLSMLELQLNEGGPQLLRVPYSHFIDRRGREKGVCFFQGKSRETRVSF